MAKLVDKETGVEVEVEDYRRRTGKIYGLVRVLYIRPETRMLISRIVVEFTSDPTADPFAVLASDIGAEWVEDD